MDKNIKNIDENTLEKVYNIIIKIENLIQKNITEQYGLLLMTEDHESLATAAGLLGNILDPDYISEKEHLVIIKDETRDTLSRIYEHANFKSNMLTQDESEKDKAYKTIMSAAYMLKNLVATTNDAQKMLDAISTLTEVINQGLEALEDDELKALVDKINIKIDPLPE